MPGKNDIIKPDSVFDDDDDDTIEQLLVAFMVLPIIEEDYAQLTEGLPRFCGYEAKWLKDFPYFNLLRFIEADLDKEAEMQNNYLLPVIGGMT